MRKIFCAAALALSLAIPLAACRGAASSAASPAASSGVTEAAQSAGGFTFTDSLGRTVTLAAPPQRVAAMLGSYADIWLLAGGELAAATQDAWDEGIVTGEETVNVGSHQQPNAESLLAAAPDFVLLTPDIDTQLALRDTLEAAGVPCAYLHVDSLEEYLAALKLCTDLTGRADLYEENGEAVRGRVEETIASVQKRRTCCCCARFPAASRRKARTILWARCSRTSAPSTSPTATPRCWRICRWRPSSPPTRT